MTKEREIRLEEKLSDTEDRQEEKNPKVHELTRNFDQKFVENLANRRQL